MRRAIWMVDTGFRLYYQNTGVYQIIDVYPADEPNTVTVEVLGFYYLEDIRQAIESKCFSE